ncbi:MAG: hypothetical protein NVS2B1_03580 [Bradyrhizobium sp.]
MKAAAIALEVPQAYGFLFHPARYKVVYGGRGSAKSWSIARALIALAYTKKLRILCVREFQSSIADSVHRLLADQIEALGLLAYFDIQKTTIACKLTGSVFFFKGIRHSPQEIKSTEGVDICWCEEAQSISADSWLVLSPTIRSAGSEIWVSFNPYQATDPTYQRFVITANPAAIVRKTSWQDNPAFPPELDAERRYMLASDPDAYEWVWGGHVRTISEAIVFKGRVSVETFEPPEGARFYHGADWGFAVDPTVLVRCYEHDNVLFVDQEAYGVGVEFEQLPALFDKVPSARLWPIKADNARPETISFVRRQGFAITAAEKWKGCVEDGVAHLKGFSRIVVHERCTHTAEEFRLYSYKQDAKNGDVLPELVDRHNHCIAHGELVETARGLVPVQDVRVGDLALTRAGYRRIYSAGLTDDDREWWELRAGGKTLLATSDHKVLTAGRGFVELRALRYTDEVFVSAGAASFLDAPLDALPAWMTRTAPAPNSEPHLGVTATLRGHFALARVQCVRDTGRRGKVYDLSVECDPEFVAGGIIVLNCIDALRYALDGFIRARGAGAIWARLAD